MFGAGWTEMLIIGVVALVVIGPKDLPIVMRKVGRMVGTVRRMGTEFQRELNKTTGLDQITDLRRSITEPLRQTSEEIKAEFNKVTAMGVEPTGVIKPAPGSDSVYDQIAANSGVSTDPAAPAAADTTGPAAAAAAMSGPPVMKPLASAPEPLPAPFEASVAPAAAPVKPKRVRKPKAESVAETPARSLEAPKRAKKPAGTKSASAKPASAKSAPAKVAAEEPVVAAAPMKAVRPKRAPKAAAKPEAVVEAVDAVERSSAEKA